MSLKFSKSIKMVWLLLFAFVIGCNIVKNNLPPGFVFLTDIDPTIIEKSRYYTKNNFLGRPVPGYMSSRVICTEEAAKKLKLVHDELKKLGYKLVVYDGYRPQCAVDEFVRWSTDENDQIAKAFYYPTVDKKDVFKLGYVSEKSGHSRGSTFDLTLIKDSKTLTPLFYSTRRLLNGEEIPYIDDGTIDMGSSFDLFHEASHHDSKLVAPEFLQMRNLLRYTMKKYGFKDYHEEWWHYTLEDEPYPDTYFNFVP